MVSHGMNVRIKAAFLDVRWCRKPYPGCDIKIRYFITSLRGNAPFSKTPTVVAHRPFDRTKMNPRDSKEETGEMKKNAHARSILSTKRSSIKTTINHCYCGRFNPETKICTYKGIRRVRRSKVQIRGNHLHFSFVTE